MIIVTGASKGLGRAICERFHNRGERVVGLARSDAGGGVETIACDVSDYDSVKQASRQIKKMGEPVSAVINAAGIASMNLAVTTDASTVERVIRTNLIGTIYCCQLLSPLLLRQKAGVIINFSTIAVALALKGEAIYVASKAGVEAFSRVFAREMADFDVRVNCIAPGPIKTDLLKGITNSQVESILSRQITQRQFEPDAVCDLAELLVDQKASTLTGQVFHVGGV